MKRKKFLLFNLIIITAIIRITSVKAISYTTYNIGDEITVNLNDSLKENFYVIEDNNDSVKAIYKGFLGEDIVWPEQITTDECTYDGSILDQTLKQRTSTWTNATNITLPTANDIVKDFDYTSVEAYKNLIKQTNNGEDGIVHLEKIQSVPFYALKNPERSKIFTKSLIAMVKKDDNVDGYDHNYCWIYAYGYAFAEFPYFTVSINESGSIRPIITVSKNNIEGGTYISENEKLWDNFIEVFKTAKYAKEFSQNGYTSDITSTSDSLKITLSNEKNTWITNFSYSNGIITYIPADNTTEMLIDNIWINNCVYALAQIKGYDTEKLMDWLNKQSNSLTLNNDGIEYELKEIKVDNTDQTGTIISSFKLDIKNGIKNFANNNQTNTDQNIKNPKTGDLTKLVLLILTTSLAIGILCYIKSKESNQNQI